MSPDRRRLAVTLGSLGVSTVGLVLLAGIPGVVAGLVIAGVWLGGTAPIAFAVAHLVLVLVVPETASPLGVLESVPFLITECGLLCALAVSTMGSRTWRTMATVTLGSGLVLLSVTALALGSFESVWASGLVVVFVVGSVVYTVHRAERVLLGLVTEEIE